MAGSVQREPWEAFILRALNAQIDHAVQSLSLAEEDPTGSVHEARKSLKRLRTGLGLLSSAASTKPLRVRLRVEDDVLRLAAHRLGPLRDRHVADRLAGRVAPFPLGPDARQRILNAQVALIGLRLRLPNVTFTTPVGEAAILSSLETLDRRARKRMKAALRGHGDAEQFHRARKAVKRLFYAAELVGVDMTKKRMRVLDALGERLGDHHDEATLVLGHPEKLVRIESDIAGLAASLLKHSPQDQTLWFRVQLQRTRRAPQTPTPPRC